VTSKTCSHPNGHHHTGQPLLTDTLAWGRNRLLYTPLPSTDTVFAQTLTSCHSHWFWNEWKCRKSSQCLPSSFSNNFLSFCFILPTELKPSDKSHPPPVRHQPCCKSCKEHLIYLSCHKSSRALQYPLADNDNKA